MSRQFAINSAIWADGRRSPISIFRNAETEQPTRWANSSRVSFRAVRCPRSHSPNVFIATFSIKIVTLFVTPYCPRGNGDALFNDSIVNDPRGSNNEITPNETLYAGQRR